MTKTFTSYDALTNEIMLAISDAVPGSRAAASSRSVSRYVEISVRDEDGEEIGVRRVRISDHDAKASCGGDIVFEIDIRGFYIDELVDDCGEFDGIEVGHDWKIAEAIEAAVKALNA